MFEIGNIFEEQMYYIKGATIDGNSVAVSAEAVLKSLRICNEWKEESDCMGCIFSRIDVADLPCGRVMSHVMAIILERLLDERKDCQTYAQAPRIGRKIYFIANGKIHERTVCGVLFTEKGVEIRVKKNGIAAYATLNGAETGKTIFFDRELAESANQGNRR